MKSIRKTSVLYFVIPICLVIIAFILWYGYPFKKFTNQNLKVYQLALTAFAATVGIGTVVNSTRSASSAAESVRVTKEKERREQSSHLVVSSTLTKFSISPPMYNNEYKYSPPSLNSDIVLSLGEQYKKEEQNYSLTEDNIKRIIMSLRNERLSKDKPVNQIKILNIGKGSSINLEVSFEFINKEEFDEYEVSIENDVLNPISATFKPSYNLTVFKNKQTFSINIVDNIVSHYLNFINDKNYHSGYYHEVNFVFENTQSIKYIDFAKSQDEISLPIPNEFMILCKHYAIMYHYKKLYEIGKISTLVLPNVKHLISTRSIKPLGRLTIKYYDEEMVKENYYKDLKKKEIRFDIELKEDSILVENTDLNFYLQVTPVPVEQDPKTQKKRAYR